MPVITCNAEHGLSPQIRDMVADLPREAPIIAMIHGYRYSPSLPSSDPHRHILSLNPEPTARRALSWPRALGFGDGQSDEGIGLAFGWEAKGWLRQAYRNAGQAGEALARTVSELADRAGRPVAMIGHSLGARVALRAMREAESGSIGRVILLTGAEFRDAAAEAITSPAGQCAEVLNITSRENDLFDFAIEMWLGHGRRQALGFGLDHPARNWIDVQIDHDGTLAVLNEFGFPVDRSALRLSHWTPYLRRGLFDFYRTALRQPWALPMQMLRARLPGRIEPRWSRLLAPPTLVGGLRA